MIVMLPQDPEMLVSIINMKLRDDFSSLDELCDTLDEDKEHILEVLKGAGYSYREDLNTFT